MCKWQILVRNKKTSNWIEYQQQYNLMNCTIVQFIMGKVHYLSLIPVDSAGEINFAILRTSLKYYFQINFLSDTSGGPHVMDSSITFGMQPPLLNLLNE